MGIEPTMFIAAKRPRGAGVSGLRFGPIAPPESKRKIYPVVIPVRIKETPQSSQYRWAGTKGQSKAKQCHQNTLVSFCLRELGRGG